MQIFIYKNGQQIGPLSEEDVKSQLATGILSRQDMVWWEGEAGWVPLERTAFLTGSAPPASHSAFNPPVPQQVIPSERTSSLAVISLVTGILSFFCVFTFLIAIICGHLSLSEIKKNPLIKGRGMAVAGLVLGYLYPFIAIGSIIVLNLLGAQVRETFKTINSQVEMAETNNQPATTNATPATNP